MCHRAARIFKSPTHNHGNIPLITSVSLTDCLHLLQVCSTFNIQPSKCRQVFSNMQVCFQTCVFIFKYYLRVFKYFSQLRASSRLAGWRRVSARGKWVDTFPNYSPPEDLCYPPTNKLTKFSSPAHATHCTPANLARPCARHQHLTVKKSLLILFTLSQSGHQGNYYAVIEKSLLGEE